MNKQHKDDRPHVNSKSPCTQKTFLEMPRETASCVKIFQDTETSDKKNYFGNQMCVWVWVRACAKLEDSSDYN